MLADGYSMTNPDQLPYSMPREQYIDTILRPSTWGGAIELGILATYFKTEIASIDVETGRIDRFAPPPQRSSGNRCSVVSICSREQALTVTLGRCLVVYSGIHYDAATLAPAENTPLEWDQTVFPIVR